MNVYNNQSCEILQIWQIYLCKNILSIFYGVKFGLKDLLCVRDMTFCNSDNNDDEKSGHLNSEESEQGICNQENWSGLNQNQDQAK